MSAYHSPMTPERLAEIRERTNEQVYPHTLVTALIDEIDRTHKLYARLAKGDVVLRHRTDQTIDGKVVQIHAELNLDSADSAPLELYREIQAAIK